MSRFDRHGEFRLEQDGNIFYVDLMGTWNKEQVIAFALHTKDVIAKVKLTHFSNLVTFTDFGITHDAIQAMNSVTEAAIQFGLQREALVVDSNWTKQLALEFGPKSRENYQREIFENRQQALAWLREPAQT